MCLHLLGATDRDAHHEAGSNAFRQCPRVSERQAQNNTARQCIYCNLNKSPCRCLNRMLQMCMLIIQTLVHAHEKEQCHSHRSPYLTRNAWRLENCLWTGRPTRSGYRREYQVSQRGLQIPPQNLCFRDLPEWAERHTATRGTVRTGCVIAQGRRLGRRLFCAMATGRLAFSSEVVL